jgi:hypothetical protein
MRRHLNFFLLACLMLIGFTFNARASTTTCAYTFSSGSGNSYLGYCVTVNGNILEIQTPFGQTMLGSNGEGYGVCDQNVQAGGRNYVDYGVIDSQNWKNPVLVSHSLTSVKIARTTEDGNWTLTQTITIVPRTPSITVVMALTNNQTVSDVAYLVRFADAEPVNSFIWAGALNGAIVRTEQPDPNFGFQLSNVSVPPFSFWQGYAQAVNTGPNACAFAFNEANAGGLTPPDNLQVSPPAGSIEMAYVGTIAAGKTKTVTLSYHGL